MSEACQDIAMARCFCGAYPKARFSESHTYIWYECAECGARTSPHKTQVDSKTEWDRWHNTSPTPTPRPTRLMATVRDVPLSALQWRNDDCVLHANQEDLRRLAGSRVAVRKVEHGTIGEYETDEPPRHLRACWLTDIREEPAPMSKADWRALPRGTAVQVRAVDGKWLDRYWDSYDDETYAGRPYRTAEYRRADGGLSMFERYAECRLPGGAT